MTTLVLVFLTLIGVAWVAFLVAERWKRRTQGTFEFAPKTFLTGNEVDFYRRLRTACGSDFEVMAQVSMGALIDTKLKTTHPLYWEVRKTFGGKICDFVICEPTKLRPVLVIELDDVMHDFAKDEKRDNFLAQAGLRTVRFWSRAKPTPEELRDEILKRVGNLKHKRVDA